MSEFLFLALLGKCFEGALRLVGRGLPESFNLILSGLIFGYIIRLSLGIIFKFLWLWRWFDQQRVFDSLTLGPLLLLGGEDLLDHPGLPLLLLQLVQDSLQAAGDLRPVLPDLSFRHAWMLGERIWVRGLVWSMGLGLGLAFVDSLAGGELGQVAV